MNGHCYNFALMPLESLALKKIRSQLLSHAHGKTLEIGVGTGLNLDYYPNDADVVAIEPDPEMRVLAEKKARYHHVAILEGDAQNLSFPRESFDTVVATLVFCTIPDPQLALFEVQRVLRPGGRFLLFEHVRMNRPLIGWLQDHMTPCWKHLAGGCHLNRDPGPYFKKAGLKIESEKRLWKGLFKVWCLRKEKAP